MFSFLTNNFDSLATIIVLLLPALEIIVRLTPTKCDDTAIDMFKRLFKKIPNRKKSGGVHKPKKSTATKI